LTFGIKYTGLIINDQNSPLLWRGDGGEAFFLSLQKEIQ